MPRVLFPKLLPSLFPKRGDAAGSNYQKLQQKSLTRHDSFLMTPAVQVLQPSKKLLPANEEDESSVRPGKIENVTHDRYLIHSTSMLCLCLCFAPLRHLTYENTPVQTVQTSDQQQEPQEVCRDEFLAFLDSAM